MLRLNLVLLCFLLFPSVLEAQRMAPSSTNGEYSEEVVALARLCVSEAAFLDTTEYNDCVGIYQVISYRAQHVYSQERLLGREVSFIEAAKLYSPTVFGIRPRRGDRAYIPFLRGDSEKPKHWPTTLLWDDYRASWVAILEHSKLVVAGATEERYCESVPQHWGSSEDLKRDPWPRLLRTRRWHITDCGNTYNKFLSPRRKL